MMSKRVFYFLCLIPLLVSCQKYNTSPFDEEEKQIRKLPDSMKIIVLDSIWNKRDSLTYLRLENIEKMLVKDNNSIPNWVFRFKKLKYLIHDSEKNKLTTIPNSLGESKSLINVNLSDNLIDNIPDGFYNLGSIRDIDIDHNRLKFISKKIGKLNNLQSINLSNNPLTFIPEEICRLSNLKTILLENTKIKDLPKCLENLQNLEWINVSGTQITYFPIEILNAKKLETIHAKRLNLSNYQEVKAICKDKNITLYYDE